MIGRWIHSLEDLNRLEAKWNTLCEAQVDPNPMLSHDWVSAWWDVYGRLVADLELATWVLEEGDRLIGVLPLYEHRIGKTRILRMIGTGEPEADAVCADYLLPLVDLERHDSVFQAMGSDLREWSKVSSDEIILSDLLVESDLSRTLLKQFKADGWALRQRKGSTCPYLDLPSDFEKWFASSSSNFRSQVRQSEKLWRTLGLPKTEWLHEAADLEAFWVDLVRLHQRRWTQAGKPGVFASRQFSQFHREILNRFFKRGWLFGGRLFTDGKAIAVMYGFRMKGRVFFYQSGVEPELPGKLRPGLLMHISMIREAIRTGAKVYDFMRGSDAYKGRFTETERHLVHLDLGRKSLTRSARWTKDKVLNAARRVKHGMKRKPV